MKLLVKLLYKPFGIVFGLLGGLAARQLFALLWSRIDRSAPPAPRDACACAGEVVAAAALQAATFAAAKAAADRAGAQTFRHLFGIWPGEGGGD